MTAAREQGDLRLVYAGLMTGMFIGGIDQTVVATALPTIVGDLGGLEHLAWIVIAYLLTATASTPLWGKFSDLYGRRQCFLAAIVIFVVGSALCGLSQSMLQLAIFRGIQGIGGGGLMSLPFIVLGDILSPRERGRTIGYFTVVMAVSGIGGPLLGGLLTDHLSWHWIFYINVPFGIAAFFITHIGLRIQAEPVRRPIDVVGGFLLVASVVCLMLVASWSGEAYGWTSPLSVGLFGAFLLLGAAFLRWEGHVADPLLPLRVFRYPVVPLAATLSFLAGALMFAGSVFLPLFLQGVKGISATNSGLLLAPMMIGFATGATVAGNLCTRTGRYKPWVVMGATCMLAVVVLFTTLTPDTPRLLVSAAMVIMGLGVGGVMPMVNLASQNAIPPEDIGTTTSAVSFARSMGSTVGIALFGAVFNLRLASGLDDFIATGALAEDIDPGSLVRSPTQLSKLAGPVHEGVTDALASAIGDVYLVAVPIAVVAVVGAFLLRELPLRTVANISRGDASDEAVPIIT